MKRLTLTWRGIPGLADGSFLRADALLALGATQVGELALRIGRGTRPLRELFEVRCEGEAEVGGAVVVRGMPALPSVGAGMKSGELVIEGDAGDDLGASMTGGVIRVTGSAGRCVGGPAVTHERGMNGGAIVVHGDVGGYAGMKMRRGWIIVGGAAGVSPGYRMLAGTIWVRRGTPDHPGLEMRRGTIVLCDAAGSGDRHPGGHMLHEAEVEGAAMVAMRLMERRVSGLGLQNVTPSSQGARWRLFSGDRFELGKGELWQRVN